MTNHNYGYDINHLLSKSNSEGLHQIEGYLLNLDNLLSNTKEISSEFEEFINQTVELLYSLTDTDNEHAYLD